MAKFLKNPEKSGFWRSQTGRRAGFYINPSRRPPRNPRGVKKGDFRRPGSRGPFRASRGRLPGTPPGPRIPGTPRRVPRGPAARGWCKTPLAAAARDPGTPSGTGFPGPWPRGGPSGPCPGGPGDQTPVPGPPGAPEGVPRALGGPPGAPAVGVLHQPLAAGPRGSPGSRSPGVPTPRCVEALQAAPGLEGALMGRKYCRASK